LSVLRAWPGANRRILNRQVAGLLLQFPAAASLRALPRPHATDWASRTSPYEDPICRKVEDLDASPLAREENRSLRWTTKGLHDSPTVLTCPAWWPSTWSVPRRLSHRHLPRQDRQHDPGLLLRRDHRRSTHRLTSCSNADHALTRPARKFEAEQNCPDRCAGPDFRIRPHR
jgi:hypothetical protein